MVMGALFLAFMSAFAKAAGPRIPTMELVFARAAALLLFAYPYLKLRGIPVAGVRRGLLMLRALLGFTALSCFLFAIRRLPLAEVTVLHYTNPIFTALIAAVAIGEGLHGKELGLAAASLAGVLVVARPGFLLGGGEALNSIGVAAALAGAVLSGGAYVAVRRLGKTEDPMVIVLHFGVWSALGSLPAVMRGFAPPSPREWGCLVGVGVAGLLAQIFLTLGLRAERAGRAMAVGYLQIVFAAALGALFWRELPDRWTMVGAVVIMVSTALIASQGLPRAAVAEGSAGAGTARGE